MMRKITKIDVQPMLDEIDDSLWEPTGDRVGHGKQWIGTEVQTLIRHTTKHGGDLNLQYSPCEYETPLDDLCLPGFRPTNVLLMYPEAIKTLVWFATTYGGKYARAMYYRTPPNTGVGLHIDAQPDKFGLTTNTSYTHRTLHNKESFYYNKVLFYYKKDRFHIVIDGCYEYTVDCEEEDRIYEYPLSFTLPVTKVWSTGEIWWFNNKRPHKSYNHGNIHKINLVFDIEGATIPNE